VATIDARIQPLSTFLHAEFGPRGFTDTAFDRMGGIACGFLRTSLHCRAPYLSPTADDVERFRHWCREHLPELIGAESR
jgi:hypothetical protein